MPRPAVKNLATPSGVCARTWNGSSVPSRPRLIAALMPKWARRRRSSMSASRVVLVCTCVSMMAGITVLPDRLTRVAPAGAFTAPAAPTWTKRVPSTTKVAFSIVLPSPTMTRAPSKTVTADCVWASTAIMHVTRIAITPAIGARTCCSGCVLARIRILRHFL